MRQAELFRDPAAERERIAAEIARRFPCYGVGTPATPYNAVAVSLADQPPAFAFGVRVADVVAAVLELAQLEA